MKLITCICFSIFTFVFQKLVTQFGMNTRLKAERERNCEKNDVLYISETSYTIYGIGTRLKAEQEL